MRRRSWSTRAAVLAALAVVSLACGGLVLSDSGGLEAAPALVAEGAPPPAPPPAGACRAADDPPDPGAPDIDCAAPPNTFDVTPFFAADAPVAVAAQAGPTWDSWAWASFAALSWPAQPKQWPAGDDDKTPYLRGVPDLSRTFAGGGAPGQALVWETLKEKRELFNTGEADPETDPPPYPSSVNQSSEWQNLTYATSQAVGEGVPLCDPSEKPEGGLRVFAQRGKSATFTDFTETDETIEVASQACEQAEVLCAGLEDPSPDPERMPSKSECLKEIFPGDITGVCGGKLVARRTPIGPRVWKGDPGDPKHKAKPVYFEVKVNYDFWDYILENKYYLDDNVGAFVHVPPPPPKPRNSTGTLTNPSRDAHPKLPFRTSSGQGPGRSTNATFRYDAARVVAAYENLADPEELPGVGSIQLKAGWIVLTDEDPAKYHTTEGYFFRDKTPGSDLICAQKATFGLLGLHIIQRVHALEPRNRGEDFAYGGTFVFATWEHVELGDHDEPTDFTYANYLAFDYNFFLNGGPATPPEGSPAYFAFEKTDVPFPYFPAEGVGAIPVVRMHPYPLKTTADVNAAAHAAIEKENEDSVWLNYRLIGTQFFAADYQDVPAGQRQPSETRFNQPYYLANLVVETNTDLQNFQGLPPGLDLAPYYADKVDVPFTSGGGVTDTFQRTDDNVIFNRQNIGGRNVGGCMGCHGVAQLKGFNFSFVFAIGQTGSGLDTLDHFEVAGGQGPSEGSD